MRGLPAMTHRLVAALARCRRRSWGADVGGGVGDVVADSKAEAHRRIHEAEDLGPARR